MQAVHPSCYSLLSVPPPFFSCTATNATVAERSGFISTRCLTCTYAKARFCIPHTQDTSCRGLDSIERLFQFHRHCGIVVSEIRDELR